MTREPEHIEGFGGVPDRSMHFTLSLHIDNDSILEEAPSLFLALGGELPKSDPPSKKACPEDIPEKSHQPDGEAAARRHRQESNQALYPAGRLSRQLRDAMEPMFSDVADRERLGVVEDYLLAIPASPRSDAATTAKWLALEFAPSISWSTEGETYQAIFQQKSANDKGKPLEIKNIPLRRFWYVHRNNSLSYHFSFKISGYEHTPQYLYLFSVLQKLVSPKEFTLEVPQHPGHLLGITADATPELAPFQAVRLRYANQQYADFWHFVAAQFNADFAELQLKLTPPPVENSPQQPALLVGNAWEKILKHEAYVEVSGLKMPNARCMFYFADQVFQDLLLPKLEDGTPADRHDMMRENFFEVDLAKALRDAPAVDLPPPPGHPDAKPGRRNIFGKQMWGWFDKVQQDWQADALGQSARIGPIDDHWLSGRWNGRANATVKGLNPALNRDGTPRSTNLALAYLFLAGFNQNIIDFINQDSSEVLDSLDPLYPFASDDIAEGFFARYANPRSLITYVRKMRSLDTGDEYIGTCPYAFLIHALTLHNEFLTRDFESKASRALSQAKCLAGNKQWVKAAERFYSFREKEIVEYDTYHYKNVFRYDTEGKVFSELQRVRGIDIKHDYVVALVDAAEKRTGDNEERARRYDEKGLSALVSVIGFLSVLQVLFTIGAIWPRIFELGGRMPAMQPLKTALPLELPNWLELGFGSVSVFLSIIAVAFIVGFAIKLRDRIRSLFSP